MRISRHKNGGFYPVFMGKSNGSDGSGDCSEADFCARQDDAYLYFKCRQIVANDLAIDAKPYDADSIQKLTLYHHSINNT